jgi:hypothetical protein
MVFGGFLVTQGDGEGVTPLGELEQTNPLGESLVTKPRDHSSVPRPPAIAQLFPLLLRIDEELASADTRCRLQVRRCSAPRELSAQASRLPERGSRRLRVALQLLLRSLPPAHDLDVVRFLGRRVYLGLAVVLGLPGMPGRPSGGAAVRNPEHSAIDPATLAPLVAGCNSPRPRCGKPPAPASCPRWSAISSPPACSNDFWEAPQRR